jgi:hypothetical protein
VIICRSRGAAHVLLRCTITNVTIAPMPLRAVPIASTGIQMLVPEPWLTLLFMILVPELVLWLFVITVSPDKELGDDIVVGVEEAEVTWPPEFDPASTARSTHPPMIQSSAQVPPRMAPNTAESSLNVVMVIEITRSPQVINPIASASPTYLKGSECVCVTMRLTLKDIAIRVQMQLKPMRAAIAHPGQSASTSPSTMMEPTQKISVGQIKTKINKSGKNTPMRIDFSLAVLWRKYKIVAIG